MTNDQLTVDDIKGMTPDQIVDAHNAGRLNHALGMDPDDAAFINRAPRSTLDRDNIARLARLGRPDLIADAVDAGRINLNPDPINVQF